MTLKPLHALAILLILAGILALAIREFRVLPGSGVTVHVFDVGQGDGMLIEGPSGQQVVVDGGPNLVTLERLGKEMSFFDRSIDLLILSHPHLDHLFSFPDIVRRYDVRAVLIAGTKDNLGKYEEMLSILKEKHIPVILSDPDRDINLGDGMLIDVLWPTPDYVQSHPDDANNSSVVFKLVYGEDSMLFTGDMEEPAEALVLSSGTSIEADILKAAHHGSKTSTSTGFLLEVDPDLAVISVGAENSYNHPSPSVIERFRHYGIPVRTTAQEGTITIELDGREGLLTQ